MTTQAKPRQTAKRRQRTPVAPDQSAGPKQMPDGIAEPSHADTNQTDHVTSSRLHVTSSRLQWYSEFCRRLLSE
ncbi:MAG: hypothetical protein CBB71_22995 [Rhodopirellula sp. TMED11]|nr:MAG: hypothetical protein CBB71_22995 [Rhodopirellula sp. TMED11]